MAGDDLVPRPQGGAISQREFEEVIRRATELATSDSATPDVHLSEAELFRIAAEVGLPREHVRDALVEVRARPPVPSGIRAFWASPWLDASRVVPGGVDEVATKLDEFLVSSRLLQQVRRSTDQMVYWPAEDWASQIARAASSTGRKYYIASAKRVEVTLRPVSEDQTWVELRVDPGLRNDNMAGAIFGGGAGGVGVGVLTAAVLAPVAPIALAVAGAAAAGASVLGGISWAISRSYRGQLEKVKLELEGVLDQLERGEMPEPPPSSWRRWVSRNFRGIAREITRGSDPA